MATKEPTRKFNKCADCKYLAYEQFQIIDDVLVCGDCVEERKKCEQERKAAKKLRKKRKREREREEEEYEDSKKSHVTRKSERSRRDSERTSHTTSLTPTNLSSFRIPRKCSKKDTEKTEKPTVSDKNEHIPIQNKPEKRKRGRPRKNPIVSIPTSLEPEKVTERSSQPILRSTRSQEQNTNTMHHSSQNPTDTRKADRPLGGLKIIIPNPLKMANLMSIPIPKLNTEEDTETVAEIAVLDKNEHGRSSPDQPPKLTICLTPTPDSPPRKQNFENSSINSDNFKLPAVSPSPTIYVSKPESPELVKNYSDSRSKSEAKDRDRKKLEKKKKKKEKRARRARELEVQKIISFPIGSPMENTEVSSDFPDAPEPPGAKPTDSKDIDNLTTDASATVSPISLAQEASVCTATPTEDPSPTPKITEEPGVPPESPSSPAQGTIGSSDPPKEVEPDPLEEVSSLKQLLDKPSIKSAFSPVKSSREVGSLCKRCKKPMNSCGLFHPDAQDIVCPICYFNLEAAKQSVIRNMQIASPEFQQHLVNLLNVTKNKELESSVEKREETLKVVVGSPEKEPDNRPRCNNLHCQVLLGGAPVRSHPRSRKVVCTPCHIFYKNLGWDRHSNSECTDTACYARRRDFKHPVTKERICVNCVKSLLEKVAALNNSRQKNVEPSTSLPTNPINLTTSGFSSTTANYKFTFLQDFFKIHPTMHSLSKYNSNINCYLTSNYGALLVEKPKKPPVVSEVGPQKEPEKPKEIRIQEVGPQKNEPEAPKEAENRKVGPPKMEPVVITIDDSDGEEMSIKEVPRKSLKKSSSFKIEDLLGLAGTKKTRIEKNGIDKNQESSEKTVETPTKMTKTDAKSDQKLKKTKENKCYTPTCSAILIPTRKFYHHELRNWVCCSCYRSYLENEIKKVDNKEQFEKEQQVANNVALDKMEENDNSEIDILAVDDDAKLMEVVKKAELEATRFSTPASAAPTPHDFSTMPVLKPYDVSTPSPQPQGPITPRPFNHNVNSSTVSPISVADGNKEAMDASSDSSSDDDDSSSDSSSDESSSDENSSSDDEYEDEKNQIRARQAQKTGAAGISGIDWKPDDQCRNIGNFEKILSGADHPTDTNGSSDDGNIQQASEDMDVEDHSQESSRGYQITDEAVNFQAHQEPTDNTDQFSDQQGSSNQRWYANQDHSNHQDRSNDQDPSNGPARSHGQDCSNPNVVDLDSSSDSDDSSSDDSSSSDSSDSSSSDSSSSDSDSDDDDN